MIKFPSDASYTPEQVSLALRYFYCYVLKENVRLKSNEESAPIRAQIGPIDEDYRAGRITEVEHRALVKSLIAPFDEWRKEHIEPDTKAIIEAIHECRATIQLAATQLTVELGSLSD